MKRKYFRYKGVSLTTVDIKKLLCKCFDSVLGFSPSLNSITDIYAYTEGFSCYSEVFHVDFKVKGRIFDFNLDYPEFDAFLTLHSDQFGGSFPTLGFIYSWNIIDFLDDIVRSRVDESFEQLVRPEKG